jgi:hypothetical protein
MEQTTQCVILPDQALREKKVACGRRETTCFHKPSCKNLLRRRLDQSTATSPSFALLTPVLAGHAAIAPHEP